MKYSFLLFVLCCSFGFSQAKNEKEERIPVSEFPEIAQNYFDFISHKVKYLKFYKETDGEKQSFEAKFKLNKRYYSIEFDTLGKLEDIEIVINKRHISKKVYKQIDTYFASHFKKTRLLKTQKQYVNNTNDTDALFIQKIIKNQRNNRADFEIIADIKTHKTHELREFSFDSNGIFKTSRVVTSSSYEHALY